jgi:mannitol/fructose-specific phosphotransferase system IIA component (Ntr-type)
MDLNSILKSRICQVNFAARSKDDALKKISRIAATDNTQIDADTIYTSLSEREAQGSTGFGNGIAIPHARFDALSDFILILFSSNRGVEFESLDKKKANLIFVLLGPADAVQEHLTLLASVSRVLALPHVKRELLSAKTPEVLCESFLRNVHRIESGGVQKKEKMQLVFIVLYLEEFFYDILEFLIESNIQGATVIDSSGMGSYLSNIPLFASFMGFMNEEKNYSKTILAMVPHTRLNDIVEGIEAITGDMDKKEGAMIMATDIALYRGTMKMM